MFIQLENWQDYGRGLSLNKDNIILHPEACMECGPTMPRKIESQSSTLKGFLKFKIDGAARGKP